MTVLAGPSLAQTAPSASPAQGASSLKSKSFSVQVVGHGKPMILIPGLTCGGDVWKTTVDHFKDRYECHVLTLAGFAGQPAIGAPMLETIRKDIGAYIREKKLDHPAIVGWAHAAGLRVTPWTFRAATTGRFESVGAEMAHYLSVLGVDAVITDHPDGS